ncbi:MAG: M42 family metallopeptidase [Candidatus Syntropharchaeales archaeon]
MENIDGIRNLLEKLSNARGISGFERDIQKIVKAEVEPFVDEVIIDGIGNLIASRDGNGPKVMLAAHMDEIGLMTKFIDENGYIRFVKVGGWFDQILLGQRIVIHGSKGPVYGVIGSKPPHLMDPEERKKPVKAEDMFIDIGCTSKEEVESLGITEGLPVTPDRSLRKLSNDRVTSKAFDNRAGLAMVIEALKRIKQDVTVTVVGTVQEEVGLKGARTSAYRVKPDLAIATDVCISGDHPGCEKTYSTVKMGKGPAITVLDAGGRGIITPEPVLRWLKETAEKHEIPYQVDVSDGGTTDATAISLTRDGVPSSVISVPARYIHSPVEVVSLGDIDRGAELIARSVESAGAYF